MIRSVSPIDFNLALKVLHILSTNPGLNKQQILSKIGIKQETSKLDSVITDFNKDHLYLIVREKGNIYRLNILSDRIPIESADEDLKIDFWREQFLKFSLYIEILQSFSFGNSIQNISHYTGISLISTRELARWAKMVGDLEEISPDIYKITNRSTEELLNRISFCQLGNLGCSEVKREKILEESGMKVDVYGYDNRNKKEYFIESESSAANLQDGINQVNSWIFKDEWNVEKWVLIPKETLKEVTFETLIKKYKTAKNRRILIKICDLNYRKRPKISNFKIPNPKDMKIFSEVLNIIGNKRFIEIKDISHLTEKYESFLSRMKRFGLLIEDPDKKDPNIFYPTFKI